MSVIILLKFQKYFKTGESSKSLLSNINSGLFEFSSDNRAKKNSPRMEFCRSKSKLVSKLIDLREKNYYLSNFSSEHESSVDNTVETVETFYPKVEINFTRIWKKNPKKEPSQQKNPQYVTLDTLIAVLNKLLHYSRQMLRSPRAQIWKNIENLIRPETKFLLLVCPLDA